MKTPNQTEIKAAWDRFITWCVEQPIRSLPATPETTLKYLRQRVESNASLEDIAADAKAITTHHEAAKHTSPIYAPAIKAYRRELRKKLAVAEATAATADAQTTLQVAPGEKAAIFAMRVP